MYELPEGPSISNPGSLGELSVDAKPNQAVLAPSALWQFSKRLETGNKA
jgi:hypothetical protein